MSGSQASYRLRGPGWGFWALEISGWALMEDELALGIASLMHGADGKELYQSEWNAVVEFLKQLGAQNNTISG